MNSGQEQGIETYRFVRIVNTCVYYGDSGPFSTYPSGMEFIDARPMVDRIVSYR